MDAELRGRLGDSTLTDGGVGTTQTRTHDDAHELLTLDPDGTDPLPALSQTHDPKGNLTGNGSGLTVGYDFDNVIDQAVVSSTSTQGQEGTHEYEYDALGRRVAKSVDTNADGTPDATTQNTNLLFRCVSLAWPRLILSGWTRLTIQVDQFS